MSALALASVLGRMAVVLVATVASAALLARTVLPVLMRRLARHRCDGWLVRFFWLVSVLMRRLARHRCGGWLVVCLVFRWITACKYARQRCSGWQDGQGLLHASPAQARQPVPSAVSAWFLF